MDADSLRRALCRCRLPAGGWRWSDLRAAGLPSAADRRGAGALPWLDCGIEGPRLLFVDGTARRGPEPLGRVEIGPVAVETAPPARPPRRQAGWALRLGRDHAPGRASIQIVHVSTGAADHLAAEIVLAEDAQASIVETFVGDGWTNRLDRHHARQKRRLMLSRRMLGDSGFVSLTDQADARRRREPGRRDARRRRPRHAGSTARSCSTGEGAYAEAGGALLARGRQRHDANLVLRHAVPNGTSRQIWRSVADDKATCSVAARVEVARDAQKTDGEQSLKGLLLARSATINAKPELEIFADDVKCAHGATVGELDRNALFYSKAAASRPTRPRPADPRLRRRRARPDRRGGGARGLLRRCRAMAGCDLMDMAISTRPLDWLADFPAIPEGWAYLDSAATAQKPQAVIDAITRGYAETYATVHRGVYQRSAEMTLAFEAAAPARRALHRRGRADEIVFVRGATEGINLVAQSWGRDNLKPGDRVLLSTLEHHSNIVPWQLRRRARSTSCR